jgi:hypothetical protein
MADNTCGNKIKKGEKKEGEITRCKGKGKEMIVGNQIKKMILNISAGALMP